MDDLLGLESEISAIQAGIQQIDKITPTPPMSFQTESMMPLNLGVPAPVQVSANRHNLEYCVDKASPPGAPSHGGGHAPQAPRGSDVPGAPRPY